MMVTSASPGRPGPLTVTLYPLRHFCPVRRTRPAGRTPVATAAHRRPRTTRLRHRAGGVAVAGAVASVSSLTVLAPAAQADGHNVWDRVADCESSGRWSV